MTALIALLGRVPWSVWVLVVSLGTNGIQHLTISRLRSDVEQTKADAQARFDRQAATYATAAAEAASAALSETERRIKAQEGTIHEAESKAAQARADAASAGDAGERLRKRYAALAASCGRPRAAGPTASASGPTADATGDLLAGVLDRIAGAAGQLAEYGDQSRIAGNACAAAYDELRAAP